ncbi:MAG: hypothetical protein K0S04_4496, partial [Herbinix sp.]|nr:hypothetical protein [Herbinix sp.]
MDYNVLFQTGSGRKSGKLASTQMVIERDKKDKSLASLKKGQQITGTVVSVDKQVTLNFGGQKLVASNDVLKNAVVGEMKTFEVMKTEGDKIELRLLDGTAGTSSKTFIAAMMKETDWDSILAQKEQNAKKAEKEKEAQEREKKLDEISAKLTEQDYGQLEGEGFPVETLTIDGLYNAIKRVKSSALQKGPKTFGKMNSFGENEITARLKAENLPVTTENLGKIGKA